MVQNLVIIVPNIVHIVKLAISAGTIIVHVCVGTAAVVVKFLALEDKSHLDKGCLHFSRICVNANKSLQSAYKKRSCKLTKNSEEEKVVFLFILQKNMP
jgi:hypothetical protein